MKAPIRYAYEFGKCDVSDWMPYELQMTEEESAAYQSAVSRGEDLHHVPELEEVLLRARDELGEEDLEDGVRLLVMFDDPEEQEAI